MRRMPSALWRCLLEFHLENVSPTTRPIISPVYAVGGDSTTYRPFLELYPSTRLDMIIRHLRYRQDVIERGECVTKMHVVEVEREQPIFLLRIGHNELDIPRSSRLDETRWQNMSVVIYPTGHQGEPRKASGELRCKSATGAPTSGPSQ